VYEYALYLVREIASDSEGSSKLMEVVVTDARDDAQAKRQAPGREVAKSVVNTLLAFGDLVMRPEGQSDALLGASTATAAPSPTAT
jgi:hypothetical protein